MPFIIAIDGPAGAGKSTVARRVATQLSFTYLDTGAMYRAAAWLALKSGVDSANESALVMLAGQMQIEFGPLTSDGSQSIRVNGQDATREIRTPEVSSLTSAISSYAALRRIVVDSQRAIAAGAVAGVVLEGRDIGTVVFPNADLKVFLTASAEERARRRFEELTRSGGTVTFEQVLADQMERDNRDSSRTASPLEQAADAVGVFTDGKSIDEVVSEIISLQNRRTSTKDRDARP